MTASVARGGVFHCADLGSAAAILRVLCLLSMMVIMISMSTSRSLAQSGNLVTAPVDSGGRVVLQGQRAVWALSQNSSGPVPADTRLEHLTLVLKRSPQRQKAFEQFLQKLQDPASRNYHHFLNPVQVGQRFGVSDQDIGVVSAWLRGQGLSVDSVSNSRVMIVFSGDAALVGAAFATQMRYYVVNGERRMATASDPTIPAALADVIQSVSGLSTVHDRSYHGAGQAQVPVGAGSDLPALSVCNGGSCDYFISPGDFAVIYDLDPIYLQQIGGMGQTIAIIGRARVYDPDIENFASLAGVALGDPTVIVPPNGQDPGPPAGTGGSASGDQVEATIDVMRAGSVAPQATIDLVISADNDEAGINGIRVAASYVVDSNPVIAQVMNVSFGACEADRNASNVQFWDTVFSQGAAEGISSFVSSGDAGAAGCDTYFQTPPQTQIASPNYICASSYSTCVGGTEFADASDPSEYWSNTNDLYLESALRYIPEGGWNEPLNSQGDTQAASSGGGVSMYIATPSWQTGTGVPGTEGRYTPDIAFSSSGHDGYFGCLAASGGAHPGNCVVTNGEFYFEYFYGTSAAAPDMAGITALLNQKLGGPQGELNQRLYQLASNATNTIFHDVTVASSGVSGCVITTPSMCNNSTPSPTGLTGGLSGYLVTAGFDEVTGLGSIDAGNFLNNYYPGSPTTTTLTSNLNPATQGVAVTFTAAVTTTGVNPPTGTLGLNDGLTSIGSATVNGSQPVTFTFSTLPVGAHSLTAVYSGDGNNAASTSAVLIETITAPDFTLTNTGNTTTTVLAGVTATGYSFTVAPVAPATVFGSVVTFACSGLDATTNCVFSPAQVSAGAPGSPPTLVTLNITTSGPNGGGDGGGNKAQRHRLADNRPPWLPLTLPIAGVFVVGLVGRKLSKVWAIAGLCLMLALLGLFIACGSGGGSNPVSVAVTPTGASLWPNDAGDGWPSSTQTFTATVSNTSQTAVNWMISPSTAGTISSTGNGTATYTAPTVAAGLPSSVVVTARSQADSTKTANSTITLKTATVPAQHNFTVAVTESTSTHTLPLTLTVQ
jgi:pseudomonalisin